MTEKKIKLYFYWPIALLVSILLLPFKIVMGVGWLIYKPMDLFIEFIRSYLYDYQLFILRHCDEAKEIKNKEARRILGFKD